MTEEERFERWELNLKKLVKFSETEAQQALTKARVLDKLGKTKYPTTWA